MRVMDKDKVLAKVEGNYLSINSCCQQLRYDVSDNCSMIVINGTETIFRVLHFKPDPIIAKVRNDILARKCTNDVHTVITHVSSVLTGLYELAMTKTYDADSILPEPVYCDLVEVKRDLTKVSPNDLAVCINGRQVNIDSKLRQLIFDDKYDIVKRCVFYQFKNHIISDINRLLSLV